MTLPEQATVGLEQLLAAKERRAARQNRWLNSYQGALVSLTLVTPGEVKDSPRYRQSMQEAIASCHRLLQQRHWPVLAHEVFWLATGPEALWAVAHGAAELKAATVALEQAHALGRLWDIDVLSRQDGIIGRRSLDQAARHCLLCEQPAHACARSRQHPLPQIIEKIEDLIDGYFIPR